MYFTLRRILFPVVLILGLCLGEPAKAWSDYDSAIQDLRDGNYEATFRQMLALAKDGLPQAQFAVGIMYYAKLGVKRNFSESFKWFQRASEQGHIKSQYYLGLMFREGRGF